jgi:TolA-binding protein
MRLSMARCRTALVLLFFAVLIACSGDKPKELLETAEFEERQMNVPHAKQLYEELIRRYPASQEADKARARLAVLNQN